jgi:hypothetical protein
VTGELALFTPPPGDYCAVKISFGPADDDAFGLSADNMGVVDHSVMWTSAGHEAPMAMTTARHDRTFEFERPWQFGTQHDERATLTIEVSVEALIAASTASEDPVQRGRDVLGSIPSSLTMDDPS